MNNHIKGKLLKTAGWMTIGIGVYLVVKGNELDGKTFGDAVKYAKDIIDAEFEVVEEE